MSSPANATDAAAAARATPQASAEAIRRIADFLRGFSIEATRPKAADIEALRQALPAASRVYLSAIRDRPLDEIADQAAMLRAAGLEPVPHVAVRDLQDREALTRLLARLRDEARTTHLLLIGGDRADAAGPFVTVLDLLESDLLQRHGIRHVGLAGHPEGHPRVATDVLDRALRTKVEAAEQNGLAADIVTQFSFDSTAIAAWLQRLRDYGIENPVRIGMAGPTNLTTLLRYAQRCGVKASAGGLARHAGLVKHLFGTSAPDGIVRALSAATALGEVSAHFFTFGGIGATARWAAHAAQARLTLDGESGFSVEP